MMGATMFCGLGFRQRASVATSKCILPFSERVVPRVYFLRGEVERLGEEAAMAGELGVDDNLALRLMGTGHGLGFWHDVRGGSGVHCGGGRACGVGTCCRMCDFAPGGPLRGFANAN